MADDATRLFAKKPAFDGRIPSAIIESERRRKKFDEEIDRDRNGWQVPLIIAAVQHAEYILA